MECMVQRELAVKFHLSNHGQRLRIPTTSRPTRSMLRRRFISPCETRLCTQKGRFNNGNLLQAVKNEQLRTSDWQIRIHRLFQPRILIRIQETSVVLAQFLRLVIRHALTLVILLARKLLPVLGTEPRPKTHVNESGHGDHGH